MKKNYFLPSFCFPHISPSFFLLLYFSTYLLSIFLFPLFWHMIQSVFLPFFLSLIHFTYLSFILTFDTKRFLALFPFPQLILINSSNTTSLFSPFTSPVMFSFCTLQMKCVSLNQTLQKSLALFYLYLNLVVSI